MKNKARLLVGLVTGALACPVPLLADTLSSNSSTRVFQKDVDDGYDEPQTTRTEVRHWTVDSNGNPVATTTQQPGQVETPPPAATGGNHDTFEQTSISEKHSPEGGLRNEAVGIIPQFGVMTFSDAADQTDSRGIAGLTIDINGLRRVQSEGGRPFLGPSLGIFYSHLGAMNSDFFGGGSRNFSGDGTHLLLIPFDLKAGYTFSDIFRPSVHAGATLVYNNLQSNAATGAEISDSSTSVHFNMGMDFEFGIGRSVALLIRPDWVFSSNTTVFSATLGLTFPIS